MDFDNVVVKDSPGLCRCCLSEGCYKDLSTEYNWMGELEIYANMLIECFDLTIAEHQGGPNGLSRLICEVCITRLRDACNFKKQVMESEQRFGEQVNLGQYSSKVLVYPLRMEAVKREHVIEEEAEGEIEYLDEEIGFGEEEANADGAQQTQSIQLADGSSGQIVTLSAIPMVNLSGPLTPVTTMQMVTTKMPVKRQRKPTTSEVKIKVPRTTRVAKKGRVRSLATEEIIKLRKDQAHKNQIKRRNIEFVLHYGNVTPFGWHKGRYRCFYCSIEIRDPEVLREHTATEHQDANLMLAVHYRTKHKDAAVKVDVANIGCKLCPTPISSLDELIDHLMVIHDAEYDLTFKNCLLPFHLERENPMCPICNISFTFFDYLLRHANKYHLAHNYVCHVCGASFQGENHLKLHHRYYHREGGYPCSFCGIGLANLAKQALHEKNVHGINLLKCPQCPETFKSPYIKKLHLANVHGVEDLKIKCPHCPKVFPQEGIMSRHMRRVHLREKNFECEVCGDKFFSSFEVKLHMRKHNGEKSFSCQVCKKRFTKKNSLLTHMTIHNEQRDYLCTLCHKSYAHGANLRVHMKKRHPEYEIVEEFN